MTKTYISKHCVISLVVLAIFLGASKTRAQEFTVVGPGGGGAMFHATVSPHNLDEVLVACDMTGSYITHDGGKSWRMFNLRAPVRFFAFDPIQPRTLYAGTEVLWRSTDDGESWQANWPAPSSIREIRMNSDHSDEIIVSDQNPMGEIVALAIDPKDSGRLVVAGVKEGRAAVFTSTDAGKTWEKQHDLNSAPQKLWIDPNSNGSERDVYAAGKTGVSVRLQGKRSDRPAPQ